jgi:hypothetical protein
MAKYETRGRKVAVGGCARAEQLGIDSPHCLRRCNNGIDDFPLSSLHHPLPRAKSRGRAHCYCAREGTNCSRDVPQTAGGLESTADPGKSRTRRGRALTKADPESLPGELGISYHPRLGGGQDFPGDASPLAGNERRRNPSSESSHSSDRPLARLKRERESREGRSLPATIKRLILKVRSRARLIGPSPPPPPPPHRRTERRLRERCPSLARFFVSQALLIASILVGCRQGWAGTRRPGSPTSQSATQDGMTRPADRQAEKRGSRFMKFRKRPNAPRGHVTWKFIKIETRHLCRRLASRKVADRARHVHFRLLRLLRLPAKLGHWGIFREKRALKVNPGDKRGTSPAGALGISGRIFRKQKVLSNLIEISARHRSSVTFRSPVWELKMKRRSTIESVHLLGSSWDSSFTHRVDEHVRHCCQP